MVFVLIALAVFFIVTTLQGFVTAPNWFWPALMLVVALVGLWLCGDIEHWYGAFAISGIALLILRVENLLLIKTDETLARIKRR